MSPGPVRPGTNRVTLTPWSSAEPGTAWPRHQASFTCPPQSVRPCTAKRPFTISTGA